MISPPVAFGTKAALIPYMLNVEPVTKLLELSDVKTIEVIGDVLRQRRAFVITYHETALDREIIDLKVVELE